MNINIAIALALTAPCAVAMMPLCSGGDDDFLSDATYFDGVSCNDIWELYIDLFAAENPEMGTNKLTYNKCSASMGEDFDNTPFWYLTDYMLAPTCCASSISACDALVEPNMCANSDDFQANLAVSFSDDDENSENPFQTCADVNKITAFTVASFKYKVLTEEGHYNGPNAYKGKVMSRIFDWNKDTCTNRDTDSVVWPKKFGKLLGIGASSGCCGDMGDDACYSSMGMLWQCNLAAARTGTVSDACAEFFSSDEDDDYVPECLLDCAAQCATTDDDSCIDDCDDIDATCAWLDVACPNDTYAFCSSRRQLAKEGSMVKDVAAGPRTWGKDSTKKINKNKVSHEAKELARNFAGAKATAKAAHGRAVQKLAENKLDVLSSARAAAQAATEAYAAKVKAGAAVAPPASTTKAAKPSFGAATNAKAQKVQ